MDCPLKAMTVLLLSNVVSVLVRVRGLTFVTCDRYSIRGDTLEGGFKRWGFGN